jgi:NAD(P)-dependent dehydrogenase (short-subunit alcohol dehydrogenase family)
MERAMTDLRFDGRVAVITGSGRGLGREYALLLAARGCKIVVNDNGDSMRGDEIIASPADEVVAEIRAAGGEAVACAESVATPEGAKAIIQTAIDAWGRIDILIHNAGNVRYGTIAELSIEDFTSVTDVHFKGGFFLTQAAFPHMQAAGYGRIVLTSSISGLYGSTPSVNYGMSKAGLIGLNNVAALEGAEHGIKANVIVPNAMTRMADGLDTSQYPRLTPDLVAPMVGWLAHESCSVSGELMVAGGGRMGRIWWTESKGAWLPDWTIEAVAANLDQIRDSGGERWTFPPHPSGFIDHLGATFKQAFEERAKL